MDYQQHVKKKKLAILLVQMLLVSCNSSFFLQKSENDVEMDYIVVQTSKQIHEDEPLFQQSSSSQALSSLHESAKRSFC
jgi:uncharacterized protein YcfL